MSTRFLGTVLVVRCYFRNSPMVSPIRHTGRPKIGPSPDFEMGRRRAKPPLMVSIMPTLETRPLNHRHNHRTTMLATMLGQSRVRLGIKIMIHGLAGHRLLKHFLLSSKMWAGANLVQISMLSARVAKAKERMDSDPMARGTKAASMATGKEDPLLGQEVTKEAERPGTIHR